MIHIDNWDDIQETDGYDNPAPGAYIAVICSVEDKEDKEYLRIEWDFAEGAYKGNNRETFERAGFWPTALFRSYKPKALGFLKAFKIALERSNPGYTFYTDQLPAMVGRRIGVVLGEEEYEKSDGSIGKRLYVHQTRSIQDIQKGDFEVPELKRISENRRPSDSWSKPTGGYEPTSGWADSFDDSDAPPF